VRVRTLVVIAVAASFVASCGKQGGDSGAPDQRSGITGLIQLGPQCPVQTAEHPCADKPAAGSRVTVATQVPGGPETGGEVVARATANGGGTYRVTVAPGRYVVTTDAGMSCQPMEAHVTADAFSTVDFHCDTGIR
jgi:hypothetical protein